MIFFDITKSDSSRHRSGLMRVNERLREALGAAATPVRWSEWERTARPDDWYLTGEVFGEEERRGYAAFLDARPCRCAAIFHDAIPLKYPHITWPRSVARHPGYMKLLSKFDLVWAVSEASREELLGFWKWQGLAAVPPVEVLGLGADFNGSERRAASRPKGAAAHFSQNGLLCVGILEPRKNQAFLLEVCAELWAEEMDFDLHLVGRVNPHFGGPILAKIKKLRRKHAGLHYHGSADDALMERLYAVARATVFPTLAEGCGLPLLESLWLGVPCVHSDLPVLRENAAGGGCLAVALNDREAWKTALRQVLWYDQPHRRLVAEAAVRPLRTWADAARAVSERFRSEL